MHVYDWSVESSSSSSSQPMLFEATNATPVPIVAMELDDDDELKAIEELSNLAPSANRSCLLSNILRSPVTRCKRPADERSSSESSQPPRKRLRLQPDSLAD